LAGLGPITHRFGGEAGIVEVEVMRLPSSQEPVGQYLADQSPRVIEVADLDVALLDGLEAGARGPEAGTRTRGAARARAAGALALQVRAGPRHRQAARGLEVRLHGDGLVAPGALLLLQGRGLLEEARGRALAAPVCLGRQLGRARARALLAHRAPVYREEAVVGDGTPGGQAYGRRGRGTRRQGGGVLGLGLLEVARVLLVDVVVVLVAKAVLDAPEEHTRRARGIMTLRVLG
jgi:hypothetical protein